MIFKKLNGKTIPINLIKAKSTKRNQFSKYQAYVFDVLSQIFDGLTIYYEFYIDGVYIDFLIPSIKLAIEVDGVQHENFNKFFHKNGAHFLNSIRRDEKKEAICKINNITLVRIPQDEALNKEFVIERLHNGFKRGTIT